MKKIFIYIILFLIGDIGFAEKIPIPVLISPVCDMTGTLNKQETDILLQKLLNFEKTNKGQIAILMISTTGKESIEEYSIRLAELWKIGSEQNNDGVILLIAKDDRTLRIEVGYGLEKIITDAESAYIIDYIITSEFKNADFFSGINNGIDRIIGIIKGNIIMNEELTLNKPEYSIDEEPFDHSESGWYIFLLLLVVLGLFIPFL